MIDQYLVIQTIPHNFTNSNKNFYSLKPKYKIYEILPQILLVTSKSRFLN